MEETQTPPQVSVLIVSYNCAGALRRCLASLDACAERDKMEVLVVDNGSLDGTPEAVGEFSRTVLLKLPRNFGFTRALNIGMRTAKGEFYFYLSPYVEVLPETVSALATRLSGEPDAAAVCPLLVTEKGEPAPELHKLPIPETVSAIARAGAYISAAAPDLGEEKVAVEFPTLTALMVRSYFLRGLRYVDERYAQTWADAEIAWQMRRAGKKILLDTGVRAVRHEETELARSMPPGVRALLASDWMLGAAVYAGKHFGFLNGIKVRIAAIFGCLGAALGALVRFREVRYHFSRFVNIASGAKVDGTQGIM